MTILRSFDQLKEHPMSALIDRRHKAGDRYVAAVKEFRAAFVDLAALDRLCNAPGFGGTPVEIVGLRHSTYLPGLSGSMTDGVSEAVAQHSRQISRDARM